MFYCREEELEVLNRRYLRGRFECVVLYGRRRIGKTALINEFCKDKPNIYFSALDASSGENLEALSGAIYVYKDPSGTSAPIYRNYADALDAVTELSKEERLIFVIDEYPYLARAEHSVSSRLQHMIDHVWQNGQLFFILCGSSMSFMEHQILGYESPLYGRRTAQIKLQALDYREMTVFRPNLSTEEQALLYGITGGIPHYINKLDVEEDLDLALCENLFNSAGYLYEEPENLMKQELREPAIYNSIISAVAGGASRANEIATKAGLSSAVCAKYLQVLLELEILEKELPVTEKNGKKTLYKIGDSFFRFWYRFVAPDISMINAGKFSRIYEQTVKQKLSDYMGLIFEKMCREFILRYVKDLPFSLREIGQWWGSDAKTRRQVQIDMVGVSAEGDKYLIGSCKYRDRPVGMDELELLYYYADVFGKGSEYCYCIFSKGGFTENLKKAGQKGEVRLYTLEDMYNEGQEGEQI